MNLEEYSRKHQFYTYGIPPLLLQFLDSTAWKTCLDLGCGDGSLLAALANAGKLSGKVVYAVDISEARVERVKTINPEFNCIRADACNTKMNDNQIDFLFSTQVIEHVPDDYEMIKEMSRLIKDQGILYISTIQKKKYAWYFYRCNGKWTLDPTHVREYTHDGELIEFFKELGFEILVNHKYLESRPIIDAIFRRLHLSRNIYRHAFLRWLRFIKIPIPGYYQWEMVCRKL